MLYTHLEEENVCTVFVEIDMLILTCSSFLWVT